MISQYMGRRALPGGGFSLYSWYFLRISGVALVVLALGHLFFTHYLTAPANTNFDFVQTRFSGAFGPFWRTFDLLLLILALVHGSMMGVHLSVNDYVRRAGPRLVALSTVYGLGLIFIILGILTVLIFPSRQGPIGDPAAEPIWLGTLLDGMLLAIAFATYIGIVAVGFWLIRAWFAGGIYRGDWGMVAWVFHRASGLGVVLFLFFHILSISLINVSPTVYNHTLASYKSWLLIPMETALVGATIYHAFNGLRVISLDIWEGALQRQRALFLAALTLTVVLVLPAFWVMAFGQ
ncbi:MAG: succinate dehydrogenase, cytochrome b556 subunit [Chloroflexota bacterium]